MKELTEYELKAFRDRAEIEIHKSGDISFPYLDLNVTVYLENGKAKKIKCSDANGCTEYYLIK